MPDVKQYRQTATVFAEQLDSPYAAYGSRGLVQGANGDYLCYREGAEQDKYVLERAIFESTHEELPAAEQAPAAADEASPAPAPEQTLPTSEPASTASPQLAEATQAGTEPPPEPFVTQETPGLGAAGEVAPEPGTTTGPTVTEGAQSTATTTTGSDTTTTP